MDYEVSLHDRIPAFGQLLRRTIINLGNVEPDHRMIEDRAQAPTYKCATLINRTTAATVFCNRVYL